MKASLDPRRFRSRTLAAFVAWVGISAAGTAAQDTFKSLDHWSTWKPGPMFTPLDGGGVRIEGGKGWIRSDENAGNFVLRFRFRALSNDASAAVLARVWTQHVRANPVAAYRILLETG